MNASQVPEVLTALRTLLVARGGLSGVNIYTGPVPPTEGGKEVIELGNEVTVEQELAAMNEIHREESFEIPGAAIVYRAIPPKADGHEIAITAARDRATAIVKELQDCLNSNQTVSGKVRNAELTGLTFVQGYVGDAAEKGRFCSIQFGITCQAHLT